MKNFFKVSARSLTHFFKIYRAPSLLAVACISYANSLPFLLTGSTLGLSLRSYGVDYVSIGLFGLLHLPYTVRFLWAPFLDQMPLPFLTRFLGQRRSWLLTTQILAIGGILGMAFLNPLKHPFSFISFSFVVTFSAASQHVLLLAYQRERIAPRDWGISEGVSIFTYRLGILTAGAGSLYLATYMQWRMVYILMALLMSSGFVAFYFMKDESSFHKPSFNWKIWTQNAFLSPFQNFTTQQGWFLILVFMLLYRLPEHILHPFLSLFFLHVGFSYMDIANATKICGLGATITGGILGGYAIRFYGYKTILRSGSIAYGLSCLFFLVFEKIAVFGPLLYVTVIVEHFFSGLMLASFFAYQLACCHQSFAATQIALLTSFTSLGGVLITPVSGFIIEQGGWPSYIIFSALSVLPGILCLSYLPFPQGNSHARIKGRRMMLYEDSETGTPPY